MIFEEVSALTRLHAAANAPIFSYHDTFLRLETVGGPMHSLAEASRGTAAVAMRILGGEKPAISNYRSADLQRQSSTRGKCRRWSISEPRLLPETRNCSVASLIDWNLFHICAFDDPNKYLTFVSMR